MTEIGNMLPPDDTGVDTLRRFRFQAEVAFPYCLNCASGGIIKSVIMEHFEDIVIEETARWRFQQVKTRNLDRGPWKLSDVLSENGGGIHALFRTYRVVKEHTNICLELLLEGPLKPGDPINELRTRNISDQTKKKLQDALDATLDEVQHFADNLFVSPYPRLRDSIEDNNLMMLGRQAKQLTVEQIKNTYKAVIDRILEAMDIRFKEEDWEQFCLTLQPLQDHQIFLKKRLTPEILKPLFGPITYKVGRLLKEIVDPEKSIISRLEQKLISGGASSSLIKIAKTLRAHAVATELEQSSASLFTDAAELLVDVRQRLLSRAVGIREKHIQLSKPAGHIWAELMQTFAADRELIDKQTFFGQDVELLIGELCELSDQCKFDWGDIDA